VIRPTAAALHVGGFDPAPPDFLPGAPVVRVKLTPEGFDRLTRYIHESYFHDASGNPVRIRPGHYPRSWFYLATGRYHAFHTSNTWTAAALKAGGVPMHPAWALTAGSVMWQARRIGQPVGACAPAGR
jgi:hypothetical protein